MYNTALLSHSQNKPIGLSSFGALLSQGVVEVRWGKHKITIDIHAPSNSASRCSRIRNVDPATASDSVHIFIVGIHMVIFIFPKSMQLSKSVSASLKRCVHTLRNSLQDRHGLGCQRPAHRLEGVLQVVGAGRLHRKQED